MFLPDTGFLDEEKKEYYDREARRHRLEFGIKAYDKVSGAV